MRGRLINAMLYPRALGDMASKVRQAHVFAVRYQKTHIYLWQRDYDAIVEALRGRGFNVNKGFMIGRATVSRWNS